MRRGARGIARVALIAGTALLASCASGGGAGATESASGASPRVLSQIEMTTFAPSGDCLSVLISERNRPI